MIRIDLAGADTASASGLTASGRSPVLKLCRELVAAGHDPAQPAEAYRGSILCLHIRSIGEAAKLTVKERSLRRGSPLTCRFPLTGCAVETKILRRRPEGPRQPNPQSARSD